MKKFNQSDQDDIWHRKTCPICDSELYQEDAKYGPEWYYKCPNKHYEHYVAFWGDIVTVCGQKFWIIREEDIKPLEGFLAKRQSEVKQNDSSN